jgi:hypothetical protein
MPVDQATLNVITSFADRAGLVRQRVLGYIERVWGSLDSWRAADIDRFVNAVVPVVTGGQTQIAALTDAYLAAVEQAMTGLPVRPVGVPASLVTDEAIRGVAADEVYRRPGVEVWTSLSRGDTLTWAVRQGLHRALSIGATDLQLAKTAASRHVLSKKDHVVGYRRVLSGSKSCGLCAVASSQRYRKQDLLPIHPGCDCGVVPIIGHDDPGQVIDPDTLSGIHEAIADRFGVASEGARATGTLPDYRDVLVTHEHGEIGPVLAVRGQHFDGPSVVA